MSYANQLKTVLVLRLSKWIFKIFSRLEIPITRLPSQVSGLVVLANLAQQMDGGLNLSSLPHTSIWLTAHRKC